MPPASQILQVLLLAAGQSRRMGRDKALLPWGDRPLVAHIAAQFPPDIAHVSIVVNPANHAAIQAALPAASLIINPSPAADMLSSIRAGLAGCDGPGPFCIHPIDVFAVSADLVRMLHAAWLAEPDLIHAPSVSAPPVTTQSGSPPPVSAPLLTTPSGSAPSGLAPSASAPADRRRAHPIILPRFFIPLIEQIPPGEGLNHLLRTLSGRLREHAWPDANLLADLDTPADYARYRPA